MKLLILEQLSFEQQLVLMLQPLELKLAMLLT